VRSSPDGTRIVFLAQDDAGLVQAFLVSPLGGEIAQVTRASTPVQSCVRWSPDGASLLYVTDGSVAVCDARPESATFGQERALTAPTAQLPENAVWSHDGKTIAFNRRVLTEDRLRQQIFIVTP